MQGSGTVNYQAFPEGAAEQGAGQAAISPKAPRAYKDVGFAVGFYIHIGILLVLGAMFMPELISDVQDGSMGGNMTSDGQMASNTTMTMDPEVTEAMRDALGRAVLPIILGVGLSFGFAILWLGFTQKYAEQLIYISLLMGPVVSGTLAVVALISGSMGGFIMLLLLFALTAGWAFWIIHFQPHRIEFATLTLTTVSGVIHTYPGTWITAFASIFVSIVWQFGWLACAGPTIYHFSKDTEVITDEYGTEHAVMSLPGKLAITYVVLSMYWTQQVVLNVVHVTISGVVGEWYFRQLAMSRSPTLGSLKRATTTSFGSICMGSLLVAIVQMIRDAIERARREQGQGVMAFAMLCLSCCMGCIESLIELFNHWAYVQVAIYGKDFITAAKDTMQLVQTRGLTGLVNMNLTSQACALGSVVGGILAGVVVALASYWTFIPVSREVAENVAPVYVASYVVVIIVSIIAALTFTSMISSTVTSGVTTIFVCWAEDPAALQASNPALHSRFEEITAKFIEDQTVMGAPGGMAMGMQGGAPPAGQSAQYGRANF